MMTLLQKRSTLRAEALVLEKRGMQKRARSPSFVLLLVAT